MSASEPPEPAYDDFVHVCPGCYSSGDSPCLPGCIDEEMRREAEERLEDDEPDSYEGASGDDGGDDEAAWDSILGDPSDTEHMMHLGEVTMTAVHPPTHAGVARLLFERPPLPSGALRTSERPPLCWEDEVLCSPCGEWRPVRLVGPPDAIERCLISYTSVTCECGSTVHLAYSWVRRSVVAMRFERPGEPSQDHYVWACDDASENPLPTSLPTERIP